MKDRWSFSEYDGYLRVATTHGKPWQPTATGVRVLAERDGELTVVGAVGGIGKGEDVKAVRWFGDVAVVVTFRQVDPLYTLDLSSPRNPRVVGELKIPGFSAYLHPVGDDLLLGVGQGQNSRGWGWGAQVSTFDLGDLGHPRRLDVAGLGAPGRSPVGRNAHTFTYLPEQRLALVPVNSLRLGSPRLAIVYVGADGALRHADWLRVHGPVSSVRTLQLADGRVAVVAGGDVVRVMTP